MAKATRTAQQKNEIFGRFILVLTIALVLLKLTGVLAISWLIVFLPMIVCFGLFTISLITVITLKVIAETKK